VSLPLGLVGCMAVIAFSALLSKSRLMEPVRYCGENSIVIYFAFFLPMATARSVLLSLGIIDDVGTMSAIVTATAVLAPLVLYWIVRGTPARILFERPNWAQLRLKPPQRLAPAEWARPEAEAAGPVTAPGTRRCWRRGQRLRAASPQGHQRPGDVGRPPRMDTKPSVIGAIG
jgi:uncharacterized membrane protein YcfT